MTVHASEQEIMQKVDKELQKWLENMHDPLSLN